MVLSVEILYGFNLSRLTINFITSSLLLSLIQTERGSLLTDFFSPRRYTFKLLVLTLILRYFRLLNNSVTFAMSSLIGVVLIDSVRPCKIIFFDLHSRSVNSA